uniref:fucolectin-like n=1 Tax=Pristiophorus japonicus TaxID=55135 RepID=UPI00398EB00C
MKSHYMLVFACLWGLAQSHPSTGNLAATIRASQSSIADHLGNAGNAIDGNANTDCKLGSCSSTAIERSPWWRVDLFYHYHVYVVLITTSKNGEGLQGAEIRIGDSTENNGNNNALCAKIESIAAGTTARFACGGLGVHGRYLNIIIPGRNAALSLCEVEAFGTHEPHHEEELQS